MNTASKSYWFHLENGSLHAYIVGEVDMNIADSWREAIDLELKKTYARNVVFDFSEVSFIDSSGLGVILGRYKKVSARGGKVTIVGASGSVHKILLLSGFDKIIKLLPSTRAEIKQAGGGKHE